MNNKNALRKIKHILYTQFNGYIMTRYGHTAKSNAERHYDNLISWSKSCSKYNIHSETHNSLLEAYNLGLSIGLSLEEIYLIGMEQVSIREYNRKDNRLNNCRETRDNKNTIIYGYGNTNRNRIRYPSLKRSKSTWDRFYKLFPHLKPEDYNGKTIKR